MKPLWSENRNEFHRLWGEAMEGRYWMADDQLRWTQLSKDLNVIIVLRRVGANEAIGRIIESAKILRDAAVNGGASVVGARL